MEDMVTIKDISDKAPAFNYKSATDENRMEEWYPFDGSVESDGFVTAYMSNPRNR